MKLRINIESSVAAIRQRINKKKSLTLVALILLLVLLAAVGYVVVSKNINKKASQPATPLIAEDPPEGKGGDSNILVDNHKKAVEAWKSGDKEMAKEYAQKVIDENKNLTYKQLDELPGQQNMIIDAYAIVEGRY